MRPTLKMIQRTFWWPNMYKQVQALVEKATFAKGMQSKSSYSKNGEETRLHKDRGGQFELIFRDACF